MGLGVYAVGEHHREEYVVSAPAVVLAAIAARTRRIRLSSAVVVLSSDDPIRVFQQFATLDLLSGGRAELWVGRGSFVESFPLFGYELRDYEALFEEKLALLLKIREEEKVFWPGGRFTKPIPGLGVYPRPKQNPLPLWVAAGGSPESAVRAGRLGLPLVLGIIAGSPKRFLPFVELYRKTAREHGHTPRLALAAHGFLAEDDEEAFRLALPAFLRVMNKIGRERGWRPLTPEYFAWSRTAEGPTSSATPSGWRRRSSTGTNSSGRKGFSSSFPWAPCPTPGCSGPLSFWAPRSCPGWSGPSDPPPEDRQKLRPDELRRRGLSLP